MRKLLILGLVLSGCADGPATVAYKAYSACLEARGVEGCQTEKARYDAAIVYANAQSNRMAATRPPAVIAPAPVVQPVYQPRQPLNCITYGPNTTCN